LFVAHWIARARTDGAAGPALAASQEWKGGQARRLAEEPGGWQLLVEQQATRPSPLPPPPPPQQQQQQRGYHAWQALACPLSFPAALPPLEPWARGFLFGLAAFAAANTVFTLARAFTFAVAGMAAARRTHDGLLRAVLLAPVAFFDRHAVGRILNR
jgi:hypothetical protein